MIISKNKLFFIFIIFDIWKGNNKVLFKIKYKFKMILTIWKNYKEMKNIYKIYSFEENKKIITINIKINKKSYQKWINIILITIIIV